MQTTFAENYKKTTANKRFLWIIETLCNAFSFVVVEKIDLRNPLIRQAPFVSGHIMKKLLLHSLVYFFTLSTTFGQTNFYERLADSTLTLTRQVVRYDPSYFKINFPNGDVPSDRGVCTDVVIRAYRKLGIDLQKEVHLDMKAYFTKYPKIWGLSQPDKNIDHRRVPNLMTFFTRKGIVKEITNSSKDYLPGDIVCWNLGGAVTHIGIVSKKKSVDGLRHLIVHNIGGGQVIEDCLFNHKIIGHYRYEKQKNTSANST